GGHAPHPVTPRYEPLDPPPGLRADPPPGLRADPPPGLGADPAAQRDVRPQCVPGCEPGGAAEALLPLGWRRPRSIASPPPSCAPAAPPWLPDGRDAVGGASGIRVFPTFVKAEAA